jgi:DNA-binding MarR family transcriptional regulator
MKETKRTPEGAAVTDLVLDLFNLNNRMLAAGDKLVGDLGLTSARWQVLGTIVAASQPQPVAWLARDMGANRQNVQRIVNDLAAAGLVALESNPHHQRASLVVLTDKGKQAFTTAMQLQAPWINRLSAGLRVKDIKRARVVMTTLLQNLETE